MNNDPSNKTLIDKDNYKTVFSLKDLDSSLFIYLRIMSSFVKDLSEDISISELSQFMFIVEKGIETITNVYKTILLYTRNIELAEYHTEKACMYYIGFITQLIGSDINVRESVLFVYKKTIFEINNECKKRVTISAEQNVYFTIFDETSLFFHKFIKSILIERNVSENKTIMSGILNEKICDYSRKINFSNDLTNIRLEKLKFLNSLITGLSILKCSHITLFNILDAVFKKIVKIDWNEDNIQFSMEKLTNAIENNYSPLKTASQLFLT
jgi:hypothetical protein